MVIATTLLKICWFLCFFYRSFSVYGYNVYGIL